MSTFKPQAVAPDSWRGWLQEALGLATRHWLVNTGLVLCLLGAVQLLPLQLGRALLACASPCCLALFALVASLGEDRRGLASLLRDSLPGLARVAMLGAGLVGAMLTVVMAVAGILPASGPAPAVAAAAAPAGDFLVGRDTLLVLFVWLLVPPTFFVLPLLACAQAPLRVAVSMALDACRLNPFAVQVSAAAGLLGVVGALWHGVAAVPFLPVLGAMLHVAFRHVFLGRPPQVDARAPARALRQRGASALG